MANAEAEGSGSMAMETTSRRTAPTRPPRPLSEHLPHNTPGSLECSNPPPSADSSPSANPTQTVADSFGIYRSYSHPIYTTQSATSDLQEPESLSAGTSSFWPYPNLSSFLFGNWFWRGSVKTRADRDALLKDVLLHPEFVIDDIRGVNFNSIDDKFTLLDKTDAADPMLPDGWSKTSLQVSVPSEVALLACK